jgi:predicted alpha/beta-hydrolase family hydrolase
MKRAIAVVLVSSILGGAFAATQDDAREDRWAQEVVPGIVVGDAVFLVTPSRAKVLAILTMPAGAPRGGVILIHGMGVHPDFGMIGGVRALLTDSGYATLSVQMPVLAAGATREDYRVTLPAASERIGAAIAFLRAKGIAKIAIVAHSVGATMADAFLAQPGAPRVDAWVPVGMLVDFSTPPKEPVQDVIARNELPEVAATAPERAKRLPRDACSRAMTIEGTDHYFESRQKELSASIAAFLDRVFRGDC